MIVVLISAWKVECKVNGCVVQELLSHLAIVSMLAVAMIGM